MATAFQRSSRRHAISSRLRLRLLQSLPTRSSQGFTLVELVVVIAILALLVAVALPTFMGVKDKAKLNVQLAEAAGLAKECSAAIISEGPYPNAYTTPTASGMVIGGNCYGASQTAAPTANVTFTTSAPLPSSGTYKCGSSTLVAATPKCILTVNFTTGAITYSMSA